MKLKNVWMVAACIGMLCACQKNEPKNENAYQVSIAKQPELSVSAGGRMLAAKRTQNNDGVANGLLYFKKADCPDLYRENFPNQKLTKEECEHVYACIKDDAARRAAGQPTLYEVEKNTFDKKAFYIVNAYSSKDKDGKEDHSDVAGDMHDLGMNGVYIKEFNTNTCVAADLILADEGLLDVTYDDSFGTKKEAHTVSDWKLYLIPDYGYYIGMDYHSAKEATTGDGDYSDWVIKLIPAEKKEKPIDETNGEVEINLSVNDEHEVGDFIATKLSIHVRALADVEVFIPVNKMYYCEADDMDISLSHRDPNIVYNTDPQYVEMQVAGSKVEFMVQYEDEGIRVTTMGINKNVIDYCASHYADGITFEVWNYFKDITRDELKPMLDQATVTFHQHNPVMYVNAFAKVTGHTGGPIYNKFNEQGQLVPYTDEACTQMLDQQYWTRITPDNKDYVFVGSQNPWDCTVAPTETQYQKLTPGSDPTLPDFNVVYVLPEK